MRGSDGKAWTEPAVLGRKRGSRLGRSTLGTWDAVPWERGREEGVGVSRVLVKGSATAHFP